MRTIPLTIAVIASLGACYRGGFDSFALPLGDDGGLRLDASAASDAVVDAASADAADPDASISAPWWDCDYGYRRSIEVGPDHIEEEMTDFPLLVRFEGDDGLAAHALANGLDLTFTSARNVQLAREIEDFEVATGTLLAWVKVPTLRAASINVLYLYYGNPEPGIEPSQGVVWSNDYAGVWHFRRGQDDNPSLVDSTLGANHGVSFGNFGADSIVEGAIGDGIHLDGVDDYVDLGNSDALQLAGPMTVEVWSKATSPGNDYLVARMGGAGDRGWDISTDLDPLDGRYIPMFRYSQDGSNVIAAVNWTTVDPELWNHYAGVVVPGRFSAFYRNGALDAERESNSADPLFDSSASVLVGRHGIVGPPPFHGAIDEIRISSRERSAAWIHAQFTNVRYQAEFLRIGPEVAAGASCP